MEKTTSECLKCAEETAETYTKVGRREVIEWLNENFEPTVPMSLDYKKWHKQLERWGYKTR